MNEKISPLEHPLGAVVLHWAHAISFAVLAVTGVQIGALPLSERTGSPIGDLHMPAMMIFVFTALMRLAWAFLSDGSAERGSFELRSDWRHFTFQPGDAAAAGDWFKHYVLRRPAPHVKKYNPIQRFVYVVLIPLVIIELALTGLAIWPPMSEAMAWLLSALGGEATVRAAHDAGMWVMLMLTAAHLYGALDDGLARVSSMLLRWVPARVRAVRDSD